MLTCLNIALGVGNKIFESTIHFFYPVISERVKRTSRQNSILPVDQTS